MDMSQSSGDEAGGVGVSSERIGDPKDVTSVSAIAADLEGEKTGPPTAARSAVQDKELGQQEQARAGDGKQCSCCLLFAFLIFFSSQSTYYLVSK